LVIDSSDLPIPTTHHGELAIKISQSLSDRLAAQFRLALVRKFSHGRPTMEITRQVFSKLGLKGNYSLGHLDSKHLLIRLEHESDFNWIWLKEQIQISGFPVRVFKWTPDF